jgi:L-lactate dehydrogenase complex protein LldG
MRDSRERILNNLQRSERPFPDISRPKRYQPMIPLREMAEDELLELFIEKAEIAGCAVYQPSSASEAGDAMMQIVGEDDSVSCWDFSHIPLPKLEENFRQEGIRCVGEDASVRVGITGADAALAATGSIIVGSGAGRYRASSLLPPVHVAVVTRDQILPDLESWWTLQREVGFDQLRQTSNVVVITGPSRTADIALQLVMGMHGPRELHIILVD